MSIGNLIIPNHITDNTEICNVIKSKHLELQNINPINEGCCETNNIQNLSKSATNKA